MADAGRNGYLKLSRKQFRTEEEGGCPWWCEPRAYSRWEAWQDLIQSAAWAKYSRMVGGALLALERGETPPRSVRFLATRWNRSEKWVRVFLDLAEKMDRIKAHQRTPEGQTYLIVNYETYQGEGHGEGTATGVGRNPLRARRTRRNDENQLDLGHSEGTEEGTGKPLSPKEVDQGEGHSEGTARNTARAQRGHSEEHSQGTKDKKSKKIEEGEEEELLAPSSAPREEAGDGPGGEEANGSPPPKRKRKPDPLWDALMEVCGINGNITKSARGAYNRARSELAAAGATAEEVHRRAEIYRRQWPRVSLTPTALAKQWAQLEQEHAPPRTGKHSWHPDPGADFRGD